MNVGNNHDLCFCGTFTFINKSSVLSWIRIDEWMALKIQTLNMNMMRNS